MEQGGRVQLNGENNKGRKNKQWKQKGNVDGEREDEGHFKKGEINGKKRKTRQIMLLSAVQFNCRLDQKQVKLVSLKKH